VLDSALGRNTLVLRRSVAKGWTKIRFEIALSILLILLVCFLSVAAYRELASEFDASIKDFAASLSPHDWTDPR
jgi:hypothetical protein